jgi:hypothetical protein
LTVPEAALAGVRTYGDLVDSLIALVRARLESETPAVAVVARIRSSPQATASLERAGILTPYLTETLAEDALRSGPGTRIEVVVSAPAEARAVADVRHAFAWLADHGVQVLVQRERQGGGRRQPHAA